MKIPRLPFRLPSMRPAPPPDPPDPPDPPHLPPLPPPPISAQPSSSTPRLPPAPFHLWPLIDPLPALPYAILLVHFHPHHGPLTQHIHPPVALPPSDQRFIAAHALPDSPPPSPIDLDLSFAFRLPASTPRLAHVLFRRRRSSTEPRGARQVALVLVATHAALALPAAVLCAAADSVFTNGLPALQAVWRHLAAWPALRALQSHTVTLTVAPAAPPLCVDIPPLHAPPFATPAVLPPESPVLPASLASPLPVVRALPLRHVPATCSNAAPFHEVSIPAALHPAADKLGTLWELLALGEHVLVLASTPPRAAAAVLGLIGLLHPLPCAPDWRPYITLADPSFATLRAARDDLHRLLPRGAVFGTTNLLFASTLRFPHLLVLAPFPGLRPGLHSPHRPSLRLSRSLSHMLSASTLADATSADAPDVYSYVLEKITRPFMHAFDRYLVPTWGGGKAVTTEPYAADPFGRTLGLIHLDISVFPTVQDLGSPGLMTLFRSSAVSKKRVRTLYARFAAGPVFQTWWMEARAAAEYECVVVHRTDLIEACVRRTGLVPLKQISSDDPADAPVVDRLLDLCLRVEEERRVAAESDSVLIEKLTCFLQALTAQLPKEVQLSMRLAKSSAM